MVISTTAKTGERVAFFCAMLDAATDADLKRFRRIHLAVNSPPTTQELSLCSKGSTVPLLCKIIHSHITCVLSRKTCGMDETNFERVHSKDQNQSPSLCDQENMSQTAEEILDNLGQKEHGN